MKDWIVKAELFWSADHIEPIHVRANTERKAEALAIKKIKQLFPNIGDMIQIVEVKEIDE